MGYWGTGLYQNDVSCDVKEEYLRALKDGSDNLTAVDIVISKYADYIEDADDSICFWLALADTQWNYGRLIPNVLNKALEIIDKEEYLVIWYEESKKIGDKRRKVLDDLKKKLKSPQPSEKRIPKQRSYICPWKVGDIFSFQITNEELKQHPLFHHWIVLQKVESVEWYPCHIIPIMTAIYSLKTTCPTLDEISKLPFIKIAKRYSQWDNQGLPIGDYKYDYDFGLVMTSKRNIPDTFVYLGNKNIEKPTNTYIRSQEKKAELFYFSWKDIEEKLTNRFSDFR